MRHQVEPVSRSINRSPFARLARTAVLRRSRAVIHYAPAENLKHVDGALIDGAQHEIDMAANFSASGIKRQDNDLIVIESAGAAASFERNFEARYASGEPLPIGARQ